jgi:hypothetical protein
VLASVSRRYSVPKGRFPRVTHPCATKPEGFVRLACVRPAASVRSEPGSNSQVRLALRSPGIRRSQASESRDGSLQTTTPSEPSRRQGRNPGSVDVLSDACPDDPSCPAPRAKPNGSPPGPPRPPAQLKAAAHASLLSLTHLSNIRRPGGQTAPPRRLLQETSPPGETVI